MKELILIKLGGSLITNKQRAYTPRPATIKRLARELKLLWDKGFRFVISHGSGSFGHVSAAKYKTADGIKRKSDVFGLAIVQQDALAINRIVNKFFLQQGLPCLSFAPSSFTLADSKNLIKNFSTPIVQALKIGALPLVFGDVILDFKIGCCIFSGEKILKNLIKPLIKADFKITRVIQCGITDGVYDRQRKTIPLIDSSFFSSLAKMTDGAAGVDVTGGMKHKLEECLAMADLGVNSLIINARKKDNLLRAVMNQKVKGTLIIKNDSKKKRSS